MSHKNASKSTAPVQARGNLPTGSRSHMPPIQAKSNAIQRQTANNLSGNEQKIYQLRAQIRAAAAARNVDEALVAAILMDELNRRGPEDAIQDAEARFLIGYEGVFERVENTLWDAIPGMDSIQDTSFGSAQMNPSTLTDMVNGGHFDKPADWDTDRLDSQLRTLLNDNLAPALIAGRARQIIEHWKNNGGADLTNRPEIIGTLYSIGLQGRSGVHNNPQPNSRGTAIANSMGRMSTILNMP